MISVKKGTEGNRGNREKGRVSVAEGGGGISLIKITHLFFENRISNAFINPDSITCLYMISQGTPPIDFGAFNNKTPVPMTDILLSYLITRRHDG